MDFRAMIQIGSKLEIGRFGSDGPGLPKNSKIRSDYRRGPKNRKVLDQHIFLFTGRAGLQNSKKRVNSLDLS
jgi:hypothetical protein